MSENSNNSARPITKIEKALDKYVYIRLKGKRTIQAILRSFDEHLNLFLEDTIELINKYDPEKDEIVETRNELDSIILRGDNVVFLTLNEINRNNEEQNNDS
ncbi:MAG: LSM domain-containing protein [Promethearchaeota archaeon]